MDLLDWGWSDALEADFAGHRAAGLRPARVIGEQRGSQRVVAADGEADAVLAGRLRYDTDSRDALPAVGDWVAVEAADGRNVIRAVLPRRSRFARLATDRTSDGQVVAANVDTIFLVMALTGDFNLRRLERYLALAWSSGADPVVVLNKADLCADLDGRLLAVDAVAVGVPVHAVSAVTGAGLDALAPYLMPGRTVALLGSSGVGKSSLANALLGEARLLVNAVRADDERGRHTTTSRQLLRLPGGALLLDTPGMRSVGLWTALDGLERTFDDIASLEAACRFSDCGHAGEPGCAVLAAVADGSLSEDRLDSRRKLERELEMLAARHDPLLRAERKRRFKQQGQGGRAAMLAKRGEAG